MVRTTSNNLRGWTEILLRLCHLDRLPCLDCIDPEDYMAVGSLHPLAEYEKPFQIYETLADGQGFALPRRLRRYDIINIAISSPSPKVVSLLLIELKADMHLINPDARVHFTEERPLALLPLPVAMPFRPGVFEDR